MDDSYSGTLKYTWIEDEETGQILDVHKYWNGISCNLLDNYWWWVLKLDCTKPGYISARPGYTMAGFFNPPPWPSSDEEMIALIEKGKAEER